MSVRMRIALGTLCICNAAILVALGAGALLFVNGPAGPVLTGGFWFAAGGLAGISRRLRRGTEWG